MRPVVRTLLAVVSIGVGLTPVAGATHALADTRKAPPGYVMVDSAAIPIPPGQAGSGGSVSCPPGTVPWGGGAGFSGIPSVGEDINSSAPTDVGWTARFNNRSSIMGDTFGLDAICANQPPGYSMRSKTVPNPAQTQSSAIATCPAGTVVLSGGALSSGVSINVELLSAWPQSMHSFKAVMWNGSVTDEELTTFAICGQKPARYSITPLTVTDQGGPDAIDLTGTACPMRTSVIGGGVHVHAPRPAVTLGASVDESNFIWSSDVINNAVDPATSTTYAICAA